MQARTRIVDIIRMLAIMAIIVSLHLTAHAQPESKWVISSSWTNTSIEGDFDGVEFLTGGSDVCTIPAINPSGGWNLALAYSSGTASLGAGFSKSKHTAEWSGVPLDVIRQSITFLELQIDLSESIIRPYLITSVSHEKLIVKDGSYANGEVADEQFRGVSWAYGAGLRLRLKDFALWGQATRQVIRYGAVKGIVDVKAIDFKPKLSGSGWQGRAGVAFYFKL